MRMPRKGTAGMDRLLVIRKSASLRNCIYHSFDFIRTVRADHNAEPSAAASLRSRRQKVAPGVSPGYASPKLFESRRDGTIGETKAQNYANRISRQSLVRILLVAQLDDRCATRVDVVVFNEL